MGTGSFPGVKAAGA